VFRFQKGKKMSLSPKKIIHSKRLEWRTAAGCSAIPARVDCSAGKKGETQHAPVKMVWKACSTLVESRADVSIKDRLRCSAYPLASSVGTARRCRKSLLLPTSMITILWSAWSRSSLSQRSTFSKVTCFAMSYTSSAPTAPR